MSKKQSLFSRSKEESSARPAAPWDMFRNLLFLLPPGDKIPIPTRRSEYETMKEQMKTATDVWSKDNVAFIDFLFKHEALGNIAFEPEPN